MKLHWLSLLTIAALSGCSTGIPVSITNQSASPIESVTISGSGFTKHVGTIPSGRTESVRVQPIGESGMAVAFSSGSRQIRSRPQGYFEGSGPYEVSVVVAPDLSVRVNGDLRY